MSIQVFLHGQFQGIEDFLTSPACASELESDHASGMMLLLGRSRWVSLLSESLPRALLLELDLPKVLLGSSGGGEFLLVLPSESVPAANEILDKAQAQISEMTGGRLRLDCSSTENLGDWSTVRKRLTEKLELAQSRPAAGLPDNIFEPMEAPEPPDTGGYFSRTMGAELREASAVGWGPDEPGRVLVNDGPRTWPLRDSPEAIVVARHVAPGTEGAGVAGPETFAERAEGRRLWGILRGRVDSFEFRVRRLQTIEEHVQISLLYKQFFAGELEVLCSLPEFWQKVTILYCGGSEFAMAGSWDALVLLAREIQRLFHRFNEENLKDVPGNEGKTISMALALAPDAERPVPAVFRDADYRLRLATAGEKDCFHVFGHAVEWRQLAQAAELHDNLGRLVKDFGGSAHLLGDLIRFYKRTGSTTGEDRAASDRISRPWRYHRRLSLVAADARDREYQRLRSKLVVDLIGKNAAQARLRPAGRVALEWAKLLSEV